MNTKQPLATITYQIYSENALRGFLRAIPRPDQMVGFDFNFSMAAQEVTARPFKVTASAKVEPVEADRGRGPWKI
jgi:hypothetical protein